MRARSLLLVIALVPLASARETNETTMDLAVAEPELLVEIASEAAVELVEGAESTSEVVVTNTGADPVQVEIAGTSSSAFLAIEPGVRLLDLEPGESIRIMLKLRALEGLEPGLHSVSVTAKPAGNASSEATMTVNVPGEAFYGPPEAPDGGAGSTPIPDLIFGAALGGLVDAGPAASAAVVVTAGAGIASAIALWKRPDWRYLILTRFYTRFAKQEILDHETREKVYALVSERPGLTYGELLAATGLRRGALLHHVQALERHGLILGRNDGMHHRCYPAGTRIPVEGPTVTGAQARVLDLLAREGPLTQRAVAETLGITQQGASYHLKRLQRAGRVEALGDPGERRWSVVAATVTETAER